MSLIKKTFYMCLFLTTTLPLAAMDEDCAAEGRELAAAESESALEAELAAIEPTLDRLLAQEPTEPSTLCDAVQRVIEIPEDTWHLDKVAVDMSIAHVNKVLETKQKPFIPTSARGVSRSKKTGFYQEISRARNLALYFIRNTFGSYRALMRIIRATDPAEIRRSSHLEKALWFKHFIDNVTYWLKHNSPSLRQR